MKYAPLRFTERNSPVKEVEMWQCDRDPFSFVIIKNRGHDYEAGVKTGDDKIQSLGEFKTRFAAEHACVKYMHEKTIC